MAGEGFPTSPNDGDEYETILGTLYKYSTTDDKWYIINPPILHNSLSDLNDGDAYEHITQTQKDALHAESHDIVSHDTDATGAELTELTDSSETTLHSHAGGGGVSFQLNEENIRITWSADGAANLNYQDIDMDSYYTVPANTVGVAIKIESKDGVLNLLYFGATEIDGLNFQHWGQVVNVSFQDNVGFCPLATGNILKLKCATTVPTAYSRLYIEVIGWWTT